MRRFFAVLVCALIAGGANAQSFEKPGWCANNLNAQEAAICSTARLSALDIEMVAAYRQAVERDSSISDVQAVWRRWRATCEIDRACIERRYVARIADLTGRQLGEGVEPQEYGPNDVVERVFRNGRFETVMGDGVVHWSTPSGDFGSVYPEGHPDANLPRPQAVMVQPPDPPALSGEQADWGAGIERSLAAKLRGVMGPEVFATYEAQYSNGNFYRRVDNHLSALDFYLDGISAE